MVYLVHRADFLFLFDLFGDGVFDARSDDDDASSIPFASGVLARGAVLASGPFASGAVFGSGQPPGVWLFGNPLLRRFALDASGAICWAAGRLASGLVGASGIVA